MISVENKIPRTLALFTMPFQCGIYALILTVLCVKVTDAERGVQFCCGTDAPPEVVSEP